MSGETDTNTRNRVFVRLLGEGTEVYRPVAAHSLGQGIYSLAGAADYDPESEEWEFKPGTKVRCQMKTIGNEELMVAVSSAE